MKMSIVKQLHFKNMEVITWKKKSHHKTGSPKKQTFYVCNERNATLAINNTDWICEDCAQNMSDLGHENSLED